ncbi:MAG: peptidoglycan DD-metalloendopeptidase family protein [Gammaproteobacteria bacterium]
MKIPLLIFILLSLSSFNAAAKKLYKFQDKKGDWHFTDKPPQTGQKVTVSQLKVEPKQMVWLLQSGEERHPQFTIRNDYGGPAEVEVGFAESDNAQSAPALPGRFIVPSGQSDPLFEISGIKEDQSFSFKLNYRYVPGRPLENYTSTAVYYPPVARGEKYRISQAFDGEFSHKDEQNKYAVDIAMPEGTPVYAARSGTVMEVEDDFFKGGTNKAYSNEANSIRILHEDGSMAIYAHLELEKAQVYPGLQIKAGQLIGYSGNTGFSSGPHLHFAVQYNKGMALGSVPFTFLNQMGEAETPVLGAWVFGVTPH